MRTSRCLISFTGSPIFLPRLDHPGNHRLRRADAWISFDADVTDSEAIPDRFHQQVKIGPGQECLIETPLTFKDR